MVGATATGKSALALELARRLPGEIVAMDASTVYQGFDVGTAKPTPSERAEIPHHLIDCCDPTADFSAARFVALAEVAIRDIGSRGRVPVLVGGTGLYLRCLLRGLVSSPPPDAALRTRLETREARRPGSLRRLLRRLDPPAEARILGNDTFRLVRALEHRLATGRPLSADRREWAGEERVQALKIGLVLPRAEREARIRARVDAMLASGLLDETRRLLEAGIPPDAPAFRALGYREAALAVAGRMDLAALRESLAVSTRQYAKRQDTWFRREPGIEWHESPRSDAELSALVERVMLAWRAWGGKA